LRLVMPPRRSRGDYATYLGGLARHGGFDSAMARYYFHVENRADLIKDEEGKSARTR
jgi:hypothetical protein